MPDYSQGKIYKIISDENDKFYIGSTIQPLYKRMYSHRNKHHSCMSKNLGVDIKDCIIVLVEKFECKDKDELLKKERFYIEKYRKEGLNIVNKLIPGRTHKQYYEDNKKKIKEQGKEYYQKNKEKIIEQQKEYEEKNKEKILRKNKKYREKNKEKIKGYYKDNKDKIKEQKKEYYEKNKEKLNEKKKKYYEKNKEYYKKKNKEYNKKNKEKIKEQKKEYNEKNKDIISERKKEKITCECGSIIQKGNNRHKKTKVHINNLKSNN